MMPHRADRLPGGDLRARVRLEEAQAREGLDGPCDAAGRPGRQAVPIGTGRRHRHHLDKGLVIDAYIRVSLIGIELLTIDAASSWRAWTPTCGSPKQSTG
jgi:gas vesicle protein GvpA/GvpJ/GvpM family